MTACCLANPGGVEICALKEHVLGLLGCSGIEAAEHTGNTHRLLGVANHKVALRQFALHTVESNKWSALGECAHHHLAAFNLVGIEAVHRLAVCVQYVVCDIHNIIYGAQTYYLQLVLQPIGALLHCYALYAYTGVTHTSLGTLYHNINGQRIVIYLECIARGACYGAAAAVLCEVGIEVACHAVV